MAGAPSQHRPVRSQAQAQRAARAEAARVDGQERAVRVPEERHRHAAGQQAHVHQARRVRHGAVATCCRTWASVADDLLLVRSMHTDQFNHHPGQLLMQCGRATFGLPSMGSWLTYGLGSESQNLPGYVVLTAGRGSSGGATLWQSGFLPSRLLRRAVSQSGRAGAEPANARGHCRASCSARGWTCWPQVNQARFEQMHDPEIASRIASYELAFRMQSAAPELIDLSRRNAGHARRCTASTARSRTSRPVAAAGRDSSARSPPTACWRGGWSSAACGSSTSSTPRGTITRTSTSSCPSTPRWPTSRSPR